MEGLGKDERGEEWQKGSLHQMVFQESSKNQMVIFISYLGDALH